VYSILPHILGHTQFHAVFFGRCFQLQAHKVPPNRKKIEELFVSDNKILHTRLPKAREKKGRNFSLKKRGKGRVP
jgi:hypothetical protein